MNMAGELWPGPMEGVMSDGLIRAAGRFGLVEQWMTPFWRVSTSCARERLLREFLDPFTVSGVPVTVQLMGTEPELLAETARRFAGLGAAGINLNFGCPSRQVTSGFAGGGALRTPENIPRIIETVCGAVPALPVSVKMRTGWSDPAEMERLIPPLGAAGAAKIFLHFRTVAEQYRPAPDRAKRLRRAVELAAGLPVILNGDIAAPEEGAGLLAETGGAGVMIGRAWLRDPWLLCRFRALPAPELEAGRHAFFAAVLGDGFKCCRAIELSNFIWGKENPFFERLKRFSPTRPVTFSELTTHGGIDESD